MTSTAARVPDEAAEQAPAPAPQPSPPAVETTVRPNDLPAPTFEYLEKGEDGGQDRMHKGGGRRG